MNNLNNEGASRKGSKEVVAVLVLDTRQEFFQHVRDGKSDRKASRKTVFLTATPEPALLPALRGVPGAVYTVLTFNAGTPKAPSVAFYVEEIEGVSEMEWVSDFPLKSGKTARQTVEAALVELSDQITEVGATVRRGRWELVEV